jgi:putative transcriptional regulator
LEPWRTLVRPLEAASPGGLGGYMFYNNALLFYNNPMTIIVRLDRLLLERQMTLTELAARVGITIVNLSILKTNKARAVRFSTLEALCRELSCQPGELLEYVERD